MTQPPPNPELVYHFKRDPNAPYNVIVKRGPNLLAPRQDIWDAIAHTYDAGHCGPRSHSLAIAMLADALDDLHAVEYCEAFVAGFLAPRKANVWNCTRRNIRDWIDAYKLQLAQDEL